MPKDLSGKYKDFHIEKVDGTPIPDDEPVFILRAQDVLAPIAIHYYARIFYGAVGDYHHASEIHAFAQAMTAWEPRKMPD